MLVMHAIIFSLNVFLTQNAKHLYIKILFEYSSLSFSAYDNSSTSKIFA